MPRYSVIIPVYKVEDYLSACVDSVLAQDTPSDYEVILVDDGSPDRCGEICDDYAARYENVRVIHQENAGVSAARNAGMAAARGEYLLFLDGDDLWKPRLLSAMDDFLPLQPDIVLFCFEQFDESGYILEQCPPVFPAGESGRAYLEQVFSAGDTPFWNVWSYLYRKDFLQVHDPQFIVGLQIAEDMDFSLTCLCAADRVFSTNQVLYRYRIRYASVTHQISATRLRQIMEEDAKWFRVFPFTPLADHYAKQGLDISSISDPAERAALTTLYFENKDVLVHAAGKFKLAYWLLRVLGIQPGTRVFFLLVRLKQCLCR